jgi:phospholipid-binding lipoprotein MlaA
VINAAARFTLLFSIGILSSCATLTEPTEPHDPFESYNRSIHDFNQGFDQAVASPVARGYQKLMPPWASQGVTNFFGNLDDVYGLANDLLQFKLRQAVTDASRIVINSTLGIFGFIDVASQLALPKNHEDFGQTLGYWGVPSGPYFVLPFFGPSTIRDSVGMAIDYRYFDPTILYVRHFNTRAALFLTDVVDTRANYLHVSDLLKTAALDPYIYTREAYLQRRQYYVYDGEPPMDDFDDKYFDDE